jgi:hypothetical protein
LEDFYKKIKDKISDAPDVPTDWGMWAEIESSLEKKRKNWFLPLLIGLPILLALAGLIGYWLAPKPDSLVSDKTEFSTDTLYLTKTNYIKDTIFLTKYITKWKYNSPPENVVFLSQIQKLTNLNRSLEQSIKKLNTDLKEYKLAFSESTLKNDPKYKYLNRFSSESDALFTTNNMDLVNIRTELEGLVKSPILIPKSLIYERPKLMKVHNLYFENLVKNKKSDSLLDHMIPDYINLGASIEAPGLSVSNDLNPGLEMGIGLNVELMFSPKFSLVSGVRLRSNQNKTNDAQIASTYPQPIVNTEDNFKNLNIKSSFIDIPFTFKYDVLRHKQNNIYLSAGFLLSLQNHVEYKYEYIRNSTEIYYEVKGPSLGWGLGTSILGIGYEFDHWRNTSAFVESYARYNFKSDSDAIHGIGFRFGIYYKI